MWGACGHLHKHQCTQVVQLLLKCNPDLIYDRVYVLCWVKLKHSRVSIKLTVLLQSKLSTWMFKSPLKRITGQIALASLKSSVKTPKKQSFVRTIDVVKTRTGERPLHLNAKHPNDEKQGDESLQHQTYKRQQDHHHDRWNMTGQYKWSQAEHTYLDWNSHLSDATFHRGRKQCLILKPLNCLQSECSDAQTWLCLGGHLHWMQKFSGGRIN